MNLILAMLSMSIFLLVLIVTLHEFTKQLKRYVSIFTGIKVDEAVDEYFRKAVIISADSFRDDKETGRELERKIIERACVIVSDVLLQHGLPPRQYNLEGLSRVAMIRLGMIK